MTADTNVGYLKAVADGTCCCSLSPPPLLIGSLPSILSVVTDRRHSPPIAVIFRRLRLAGL